MTVKVMIVDDSSFFRKRLTEIISSDARLQVVATASNGEEALIQLQQSKPDVITMDLEMPVMDGITAVRKIQSLRPTPVLMLSTWTTEGAKSTLDALEAGATDFVAKRFENLSSDHLDAQQQLCQRIYQLAHSFQHKPVAMAANPPHQKSTNTTEKPSFRPELIVIGASTGGPVAVPQILTKLPAQFPYPILLIQHMPAAFTPSFAERMNHQCAIKVKQAEDGEALKAGTVYLAPGGQQMLVKGRPNRLYLSIVDGEDSQTYKPCIDLTLESVAKVCGDKALSIILTGMGSDGRNGCQAIKHLGGMVWAQDQASSTIYGMPMAIAKAGLADKILNLTDISRQLMGLK